MYKTTISKLSLSLSFFSLLIFFTSCTREEEMKEKVPINVSLDEVDKKVKNNGLLTFEEVQKEKEFRMI